MKTKSFTTTIVLALCMALGASLKAQPSNLPTQPDLMPTNDWGQVAKGVALIGKGIYDAVPTNNTVAIYGTYVLKPKKYGFGIMDAYNIKGGIGVVGGVDYLGGQWLGVSGGIQLKKSFEWNNFTVTPFFISALLTPIKGGGSSNGDLGTANSAGLDVLIYKKFSIGGLYGIRTGAGSYGGGYANGYMALKF